MKTTTITLTATSTKDKVLCDANLPSAYSSIVSDMIHIADFGTHTVDIDLGNSSDDGMDPNAAYVIMYFPDAGRAAVSDNGSVHWTDASSIEDAHRRYLADEMAA